LFNDENSNNVSEDEQAEEIKKEALDHSRINKLHTTVHIYESIASRGSNDRTENQKQISDFGTDNLHSNLSSNLNLYTENGTNMLSNMNSNNMLSNNGEEYESNTYDTLRKFQQKKFEDFDSNNIKF
jgi:hypothetical protein